MSPPSPKLDVYREWLGIHDAERPLNYYQLLRLDRFEDDPAKIRGRYGKMSDHIRQKLTSEHANEARMLLDELAKAMLALTDRRRKKEYDSSLGRSGESTRARGQTFEEILIQRKVLDAAQLQKAKQLAVEIGVDLRDAVMQLKLQGRSEAIMLAYAESLGLPYVDLEDLQIDENLVRKLPAIVARTHSCVPIMLDGEKAIIASPNPLSTDVEEEVRLRFKASVRTVLCSPTALTEVIRRYYPRELAAAETASTEKGSAKGKDDWRSKMDPEERAKRRKQIAMVSFMLPFMGIVLASQFVPAIGNALGTMGAYGIGFLVASVAAAIGWFTN